MNAVERIDRAIKDRILQLGEIPQVVTVDRETLADLFLMDRLDVMPVNIGGHQIYEYRGIILTPEDEGK